MQNCTNKCYQFLNQMKHISCQYIPLFTCVALQAFSFWLPAAGPFLYCGKEICFLNAFFGGANKSMDHSSKKSERTIGLELNFLIGSKPTFYKTFQLGKTFFA